MIINLLSGPRNISTALMYSFAQRADTQVVDEPFYAYYLVETGVEHPGREEIIESMPVDYEEVLLELESQHIDNNLFLKNMSHHMVMNDWEFIRSWTNLFLIRNPEQLISSFVKVIPNPTMDDIGLKREWELFQYLLDADIKPVVLDSNEVLKDPKKVLDALCEKLQIPFDQEMLHWQKGGRNEDGIWAKYWYNSVHNSVGFSKQPNKKAELSDHLKPLLKDAQYYYELLAEHSIKG